MSQQTINVGAAPNDGTGTPLRTAFQYTNSNFTELYTALGGGAGLPGATTQVIFNDGGTNLAGDAGLTFNKATGLLTAASASITGDLTVRTTGLVVKTSAVGIGTASPFFDAGYGALDIRGTTGGEVVFGSTSVREASITADGTNGMILNTVNSTPLRFYTAGGERARIDSSGNLGLGVTPSAKLDVQTSAGRFKVQNYGGASVKVSSSGAMGYEVSAGNGHLFFIDVTQAMTLDASGNLLVGATSSNGKLTIKNPNAGSEQVILAIQNAVATGIIGSLTFNQVNDNFGIVNSTSVGSVFISTIGTERVRIKNNGQVRFVPLSADPAGAEAGDVYYNSTSNKLKCYNGTSWNDLF